MFPWYTLLHHIRGERAIWLIITTFLCCQYPNFTVYEVLSHFFLSRNNLRGRLSPSWPSFDRSESPDPVRLLLSWGPLQVASAVPGSVLLGDIRVGFNGILIASGWPESSAPVLSFCFGRGYSLRTHISLKKTPPNKLSTDHLERAGHCCLAVIGPVNRKTSRSQLYSLVSLKRQWSPSTAIRFTVPPELDGVVPSCVLAFLVMKCYLCLFSLIC